jgi:hypothetical protein
LVEELEAGYGCKALEQPCGFEDGEKPDPKPTRNAFYCSSMLLGNALLALGKEFGPRWRDGSVWSESVDKVCGHLEEVSRKLDGPSVLEEHSTRVYYDRKSRESHSNCVRSTSFADQLGTIYRSHSQGLKLEEVGNRFYRLHDSKDVVNCAEDEPNK